MHPYAHLQHLKVLNTLYTSNMDVGCSQWGFEASTMTPKHHTGSAIPHFPKTHPHQHTYYSIRMHSYAHPQHLKVLKHFIYIQYGCGMQSMGVFSLNHDTATAYRLGHTPISLKFTPTCTCNTAIRMHPYAHPQSTASQGAKPLLYTSNMDVGCSQWGLQPQP
jgi:hypothetical protein